MPQHTKNPDLLAEVHKAALALEEPMRHWRRQLHRHPETAWTEFYTAAFVASHLQTLELTPRLGAEALRPELRMHVPPQATLQEAANRALREGADPALIARMAGGLTGIIAELDCTQNDDADQAPVVALRVDLDGLPLEESTAPSHEPYREGYRSQHPGCMHACGHDLHTSLGLGLATLLSPWRSRLRGKVRFIFQPAEEGVAGALSVHEAVADVDYLLGMHVGLHARTGQLCCTATDFLATSKLDVRFHGRKAHAGLAPQEGHNALLAACSATLALHALPRHGKGETRVGVGTLDCRCARNVVPDAAFLAMETRGADTSLNAWMEEEARRIVHEAAELWHCTAEVERTGHAPGGSGDAALADIIAQEAIGLFADIHPHMPFGASEDFSVLMEKVQENSGLAAYIMLGADTGTGHHTSAFHVDEGLLRPGLELLARVVLRLLAR